MPAITLVICLHKERDHLERLLENADGCYDDLVVVHDGPENDSQALHERASPLDFSQASFLPASLPYREIIAQKGSGSISDLVLARGGRFFEGPRAYQQEPHWPFAWAQAKHDWILRLDADELPSEPLRKWLQDFRRQADIQPEISGYSCIWPLWNGQKSTSDIWPKGRFFFFNRLRVRFFGMVEQTPIPDGKIIPLDLILHHRPLRKSYGIRNILLRPQAYRWREQIARSLQNSPLDLPRWRWDSPEWPSPWREKILNPLSDGFKALYWYPLCQGRSLWKAGLPVDLSACLNPGVHHFMLGWAIKKEQCRS